MRVKYFNALYIQTFDHLHASYVTLKRDFASFKGEN